MTRSGHAMVGYLREARFWEILGSERFDYGSQLSGWEEVLV